MINRDHHGISTSTMRAGHRYSVRHEDILAAAELAKEELLRRKNEMKSIRVKH